MCLYLYAILSVVSTYLKPRVHKNFKQVSEHHLVYSLTACVLIAFKTSFSHLILKLKVAHVNNELFNKKFFTDRCHTKKDFRLFSRLKKQQFKVMKKESTKRKLSNKLEKARKV